MYSVYTHTHTLIHMPLCQHTLTLTPTHPLTHTHSLTEPQAPNNEVKFFTLNRRTSRNTNSDPFSKLTQQQNIEVDSRLRSEYNQVGKVALDTESHQRGYETNQKRPHSMGSHSLENVLEGSGKYNGGGAGNGHKQQARDVLVSKITEAAGKEKRMSNGIRMSPVSTKGEVTTTQSTKMSPPPPATTTSAPSAVTSKGVVAKGDKAAGVGGDKSSKVGNKSEVKGEQTSQRDSLPSDSSSDTIPSVRPESSNSSVGGPFSPTDEFQFIGSSEGEPLFFKSKQAPSKKKKSGRGRHDSTSSEELYDRLEPYEESESNMTTPAPATPTPSNPGISITQGNGNRWSVSSNESGEYDHLPALQSPPVGKGKISLDQLPSMLDVSSYRRITSQPALSTPASARESPVERSPRSSIIREETSEEEDDEEEGELGDSFEQGKSPDQGFELNEMGQLGEGVVLRKRRHLDPFADILGSTTAASRLRWSQELNPLYNYIKDYKVSESVKLYDSPSKLLQSVNASDLNRKSAPVIRPPAPSIIVEEESETSSREQTCSPSESQGEGDEDTKSELEMPRETSTLPRMKRPHVYEEISFADLPPEEERPSSEMGMVEKLKMRRTMYEKEQQKTGMTKSTSLMIGRSDTSPVQRKKNIKALEKAGVSSPRIGKRELLQQRRSRTIHSVDDSATEKRKQRSMRAGDSLKVC